MKSVFTARLFLFASNVWAQFPTTSILDDFNRTDASPIDGNWSSPSFQGDEAMDLVSNEAVNSGTGLYYNSYYDASTYGADAEIYFTITTIPENGNFLHFEIRYTNPNSGNETGYEVTLTMQGGADAYETGELSSGSYTVISSGFYYQTTDNDDGVGIEVIGTSIDTYFNNDGAGWSLLNEETDSTHTGSGYLAVGSGTVAFAIDDFGGGTIGAAPSNPSMLPLMGVGN